MTVSELDRLVTKTEITPASKRALRDVRKAVMSGEIDNPQVGSGSWSVTLETVKGASMKMTFSFRRN